MRVGLYFGSFNPIHIGHLIIAESLLNEAKLDQVWLVVSPENPLKARKTLIPAYDRLRLAELATEGNPRIYPSNVEFALPRPSFTIDTLTHLATRYASYSFSILMGADNLASLPRWKNYRAILEYYPIYVYPRVQHEDEPEAIAPPELAGHPNVTLIAAPLLDLSATAVRKLIAEGKSARYLVPDAALEYIDANHLYR